MSDGAEDALVVEEVASVSQIEEGSSDIKSMTDSIEECSGPEENNVASSHSIIPDHNSTEFGSSDVGISGGYPLEEQSDGVESERCDSFTLPPKRIPSLAYSPIGYVGPTLGSFKEFENPEVGSEPQDNKYMKPEKAPLTSRNLLTADKDVTSREEEEGEEGTKDLIQGGVSERDSRQVSVNIPLHSYKDTLSFIQRCLTSGESAGDIEFEEKIEGLTTCIESLTHDLGVAMRSLDRMESSANLKFVVSPAKFDINVNGITRHILVNGEETLKCMANINKFMKAEKSMKSTLMSQQNLNKVLEGAIDKLEVFCKKPTHGRSKRVDDIAHSEQLETKAGQSLQQHMLEDTWAKRSDLEGRYAAVLGKLVAKCEKASKLQDERRRGEVDKRDTQLRQLSSDAHKVLSAYELLLMGYNDFNVRSLGVTHNTDVEQEEMATPK